MSDEYDWEGYRIIPPLRTKPEASKGIKCGKCGMKFDNNVAYGYYCPHNDCPVFVKATL